MQKAERQVYAEIVDLDEKAWFMKYKQCSKGRPYHILLESGRGGRYSFIGLEPIALLRGKGNVFTVYTKEGCETFSGDLLTCMKTWMENFHIDRIKDGPSFQGGAIGFFSYDLVRQIERLEEKAADDLNMDDLYFFVFEDVVAYDHLKRQLWMMTCTTNEQEARQKLAYYRNQWVSKDQQTEEYDEPKNTTVKVDSSFSEGQFVAAVEKIQQYISQGDVFQVNLSVRLAKPLITSPLHIYEKLREINPSPYMAYIHTPEFQIVSGSPELLIKKRSEKISTRPIAGTRSRGMSATEDERIAKTLMENEKERAEHIMLVDLERNDLGRVCKYGSVVVDELMVIERYSHVMHIVSNVSGILDTNKDVYDIIRATFPGGTITGAPKVRTMEIIEELEPVRRGIYTGSIGWIGFDGDMELNIAIRTLLAKDGLAYVQAGAGIVIDSIPEAEYKESLKKAQALLEAMEMSEEEFRKIRVELRGSLE